MNAKRPQMSQNGRIAIETMLDVARTALARDCRDQRDPLVRALRTVIRIAECHLMYGTEDDHELTPRTRGE